MFQNFKKFNHIVKMLKAMEDLSPSYKEFIEVLKENPLVLEIFDARPKYSKEEAVERIASSIRRLRNQ